MSVSSKWYVQRIDSNTVWLMPVCRGVENREWAQATPAGQMHMLIQNEAALSQFTVGEEFEVVFREVPKPQAGDGHPVKVVEQKDSYGSEKVYYSCGTCGDYARLNEDGTPDWSAHDERYAKAE
jgi:hypothetical protein